MHALLKEPTLTADDARANKSPQRTSMRSSTPNTIAQGALPKNHGKGILLLRQLRKSVFQAVIAQTLNPKLVRPMGFVPNPPCVMLKTRGLDDAAETRKALQDGGGVCRIKSLRS